MERMLLLAHGGLDKLSRELFEDDASPFQMARCTEADRCPHNMSLMVVNILCY